MPAARRKRSGACSFEPNKVVAQYICQFLCFAVSQTPSLEFVGKVRDAGTPPVFFDKSFQYLAHGHALADNIKFNFVFGVHIKLNNRLICEIICYEYFRRLLVDSEVVVDRIAEMHTEEFASIMNIGRLKVLEKSDDENALDARTLEIAEELDKHYIESVLTQDLLSLLNDIREKHLTDSTTADALYTADEAHKKIDEVMNFKGSEREKQPFLVCNQLQIPYNTLKPDEKAALLSAISKSKILGKLGKHGRGKRNHKK